jgi:hypothetical protein
MRGLSGRKAEGECGDAFLLGYRFTGASEAQRFAQSSLNSRKGNSASVTDELRFGKGFTLAGVAGQILGTCPLMFSQYPVICVGLMAAGPVCNRLSVVISL